MKKFLALMIAAIMVVLLAACGEDASVSSADGSESVSQSEESSENAGAEENQSSDVPAENSSAEENQSSDLSSESKDSAEAAADGLRPEFKEAMDSYEAFFDEYVAFMEKYAASDGSDLSLLADYASYMSTYADMMADLEAWDSEEMSPAETAYYIEVQARISQKLLSIAE